MPALETWTIALLVVALQGGYPVAAQDGVGCDANKEGKDLPGNKAPGATFQRTEVHPLTGRSDSFKRFCFRPSWEQAMMECKGNKSCNEKFTENPLFLVCYWY